MLEVTESTVPVTPERLNEIRHLLSIDGGGDGEVEVPLLKQVGSPIH